MTKNEWYAECAWWRGNSAATAIRLACDLERYPLTESTTYSMPDHAYREARDAAHYGLQALEPMYGDRLAFYRLGTRGYSRVS